MKKISLYILLVVGVLGTTSCEKFLDVNDDVDQPFTSTPDSLLPAVINRLAVSHFKAGETSAYFTQQVATLSSWSKYKTQWSYSDANRIAEWRYHYHDVSVNALHVIASSNETVEKAKNYEAVAQILYASSTLMTTDLFGDIAYTEAFKGKPNATYDPQSDIYKYVLADLDKAIDLANEYLASPAGNLELTMAQDIVYGGDLQLWKAYAYALKARALLHLTPNVNTNYNEILVAAQSALDNGFVSAVFDYSLTNRNDWDINAWGPKKADPGGWETSNNTLDVSAPSLFMLERALNYDSENNIVYDPRQPLLMEPRYKDGSKFKYLSVHPGDGKVGAITDGEYPDLYNSYATSDDSKLAFMTVEELYFIIAEAAFNVDLNKSFQYFQDGIREHMINVGVSTTDIETYLSSQYVPQTAGDLTISHIMMQKFLVTYLHHETWVDMRRYGNNKQIYKGLERPSNLVDYFEDDATEPWIQRLPYDTETEEIYNKEQLVEMGAYQNPEWLKVKMSWAK